MNNGVDFGWNWNEFDLWSIPFYVGPPYYENGEWVNAGIGGFGSDLLDQLEGGLAILPLPGLSGLASLAPNTQQPQNPCTSTILSDVNNQFGTNFTPGDVQSTTDYGQATNLNIVGNGLSASQFNSIQTGRYPLNWWSYMIGYGPTLHVTGQTYFDPYGTFQNGNVGGATSVLFTAHIDTSFAYNPIGALIHLLIDVLHLGGPRKPC
jgi:hypothetical protein